ncbi:peptidase M14 [Alteromonas sediminis]|uniref:Peptidase M14 n=1 Tax=Alteromonas sediminis TaxID=2259342 RepID=A0A3N5Z744_9ALTE|nr:M14 metallopeptidase family protein [Alteromonas sediminis]RPJ66504.1 peptidase M14 [Alteromonas sediminis]
MLKSLKLSFRAAMLTFASALLFAPSLHAQFAVEPYFETGKPASDYLPADTTFNPAIKTPEAFFGYNVGKWHVRHDQLLAYMQYLSDASDRVSLQNTGKTHEDRQLVLMTFSAPEKQAQLEQIRQQHLTTIQSGKAGKSTDPLVFYMGYSIHGNEPSGSNAALVVAYYLAAGQDSRIDALLNQAIVLFDPSMNPDGLSRFAQWANQHKSKQLSKSPFHREHSENWPSGRTNHYWFDLNRDWLLLTHPESRARVTQYQKWRPHVLTDFHEMGTNSTYFFQPGIRSRKNPLTPDANVTLTEAIAAYHAKALDATDQLYFTEESFDDFYFGKGSTYPDAHGSIGILFEQASSRGHLQASINGDVAFHQTIQNQITTSLSTFDGALANKAALIDYQASFARQTQSLIKEDETAGVIIDQGKDPARFAEFLDRLDMHQIRYRTVTEDLSVDGKNYVANNAVLIAYDQPQYRLIKSLFSERTDFPDNTFYDVSNWNFGYAFGLTYSKLSSRQARGLDTSEGRASLMQAEQVAGIENAVAYAFDWHHYFAPALTQKLLQNGFTLRAANKAFTAKIGDTTRRFEPGTMLITKALNQQERAFAGAQALAETLSIPLYPITSGLTPQGIDLGSRNMAVVTMPSILILGGQGTSQYEVGEIWHYIDTRVGAQIAMVDLNKLSRVDLSQFTHVIAASGNYSAIGKDTAAALTRWVKQGGTLIGQKSALRWFKKQEWLDINIMESAEVDALFATEGLSFADRDALRAKKRIAGTAFEASIDNTHPLFFGITTDTLPFFKTTSMMVEDTFDPFETLATYTKRPLLGGYAASELVEQVKDSAAVVVQPSGRGRVIGFVDNVNFRGYWFGTSKLMGNALYLSPLMN